MKLYYAPGACSQVIRILVHELGIPCDFEAVDLRKKKTEKGEDFLAVNPKGSVPVLQLDHGDILTENAIIQQYLADKHNALKLLPAVGDMQRYRVLEWVNYVSTELHKGCAPMFNPKMPQAVKDEVLKPAIDAKLALLDAHLKTHRYLNGDHYSLADMYCFVVLGWLPIFDMSIAKYEHLTRYVRELLQRKAIQQALTEEGISRN